MPHGQTTQSVCLRLHLHKPHPFSVYLSSPAGDAVKILALEILIRKRDASIFDSILAVKNPITLSSDACNVFSFTDEQLSRLLPHLQVGTTVKVDLSYSAPVGAKVTIGIIGKHSHKMLGTFIERLFHSER